jgi:hypothetical protein
MNSKMEEISSLPRRNADKWKSISHAGRFAREKLAAILSQRHLLAAVDFKLYLAKYAARSLK